MSQAIVPSVGAEAPVGKSETSGSRPSGGAGEIFDAIKAKLAARVPAEAPKPPEDLAKKEEVVAPAPKPGSTEEALADAGKAPETPAKAADEKEKAKKPSIRSIVKASNIPAEDKEPITNLAYMGYALHEIGVTPDVVKMFVEQGVTPATIEERIKLHPTVDDAKRDAWYASEMRRVANDYNTDPQKFIVGLKTSAVNAPGVFNAFIEVASTYLKEASRSTWVSMLTDGFKNALYNLGQEASTGNDEETAAAVAIVQSKFGFTPQQIAASQAAPAEDPAFTALKQRNAELESRQQQEAETSRASFLESVVTEARNVVYREIDSRWRKSAVAGLTEAETKRAIDDIFYAVEQDLSAVENFVYDMNAKRNGPLTQQAYRDAVKYAFDRALPFIPKHQKAALEFWTPRALAAAQNRDLTEKKAAAQVDAAGVGGSVPAPAGSTKQSKLDELRGRKDLTFREKVAASFSR